MKFTTPVIRGRGRGKILGFPTLNLQIPPALAVKPGIYAGWVWIDGKKYLGAFHYGPIPVFSDPSPHLEVFVLDYSSDHPITLLTFELLHYLRPIRNFKNPASLARRISLDVLKTKQLFS
ncbi:MAG: hypothetical protein A2784_01570 [Candidatus Chisholmbacteria bacterium RIFCSPHIGHO2_01_FULL_48_12]|uniref:riboflavin kinase n=1 Tax=Candidatus Chisholmbacteria bacterium RIFCSPHIGHO2_01_FULL_48_12 TaxID=1797589 RepID=A0A1G1VK55_9BACT|nr:MAG: hypothetical protein A2784_01570 [Candidatus Chisholmbacteria bacterium RIFCSPHIGHO2_01_FULL_48_12]